MHTVPPLIDRINSARPWYAQVWPWLLMLGPCMVMLAAVYTGWLAFAKPDAMVVDDYYKQGQAINQDLHRDRIAASLGLSFDARYDAAAEKLNGTLLGFGKPIGGKISIHLAHATQPEKDLKLAAQLDRHGEFSVALPILERARWQVVVESEQRDWRLTGAWTWPQQQTVDIQADLPPAD
ncbi:FixH family protein [Paraherbaspirillum soli]|uniref:FixH family protein n=1 Tax=Paraherbaspirillum soli TaxID=631222 RepID=A0ABW0M9K6_9BURK